MKRRVEVKGSSQISDISFEILYYYYYSNNYLFNLLKTKTVKYLN